MINMVKLPTNKSNLFLRVAKGHFATSHSHINYYIDVTTQKSRLSEAKAVAKELVAAYQHNTIVDTVLCLDGTQVIGTCLANELTKDGFANMNAHQTIYVVTPEHTTGSQLLFRENTSPMIAGKQKPPGTSPGGRCGTIAEDQPFGRVVFQFREYSLYCRSGQ